MRLVSFALIFIGMTLVGCDEEAASQTTIEFAPAERLAENTDPRLRETSGIAASHANPGLIWTQNDSGNEPEIYLVDTDLKIKLIVRLADIENRDWEDIAVGPGPDPSKTYVYIADIGDNLGVYPYKYIYRFVEPKAGSTEVITLDKVDRIVFELEDGMKDTESLMVDPQSKKLYILSKREFPASMYEIENIGNPRDTITAPKVLTLPMLSLVAADCNHKDGSVLMKNYTNVYCWENNGNQSIITLLKGNPKTIAYESEPQGEAITWAVDGTGFYTLSERPEGQDSYLYFYARK